MSDITKLIHSIPVDPLTGSISVPIYQTSTFVQDAPGEHKGYDYARSNNPTREVLEKVIAQLEGGKCASAFASGLAAIDAVLKLLESGDEIVAVDDIYGGAFRLFTHIYAKFGIKVHYVDTTDVINVVDAITPKTKLVWLETPTNPTLKISDIAAIAAIAKQNGALLCVDNTFASPALQQPIKLGADLVVHSATKYIVMRATATPLPKDPCHYAKNAGTRGQNKIYPKCQRRHTLTARQLACDSGRRNAAPAGA